MFDIIFVLLESIRKHFSLLYHTENKIMELFQTEWGQKKVNIYWLSEGIGGEVPSTPTATYPSITVREMARLGDHAVRH